MSNYLIDKEFLNKLDLAKEKEIFVKIILLTIDELPLTQIEGYTTQGTISIDGTSAMRRTCSLSMVAAKMDAANFDWCLNSKFSLSIGVANNIDPQYPNIIWFPQGIFVFTSISISQTISSFTVSLSGKDKMCLLNGEIGGSMPFEVDFGKMEEQEYIFDKIVFQSAEDYTVGKYYIQTPSGYEIDQSEYSTTQVYYQRRVEVNYINIPVQEIIRNAVNVYGKESLHNIVINDIEEFGVELLELRVKGDTYMFLLREVNSLVVRNISFNARYKCYKLDGTQTTLGYTTPDDLEIPKESAEKVKLDPDSDTVYTVVRVAYGDPAGYRLTDLTYPGDLICGIGESLVSILDKIKNMLGDFEYFYDVDGRFVFQKKPIHSDASWNSIVEIEGDIHVDPAAYTSAVTYNFEHGALVTAFQNTPNLTELKNDYSIWGVRKSVTGGEIPIHMRYAIDDKPVLYRKIEWDEDNPDPDLVFSTTGYGYYDWRELIYQMALDYFKYSHVYDDFLQRVAKANPEHFPTGHTGYEQYYTDLQGFWRQLYDPEGSSEEFNPYYHWNKNVDSNPSRLNFWFDFLDAQGAEMDKYKVSVIGSRTKAINDSKITSVFFKDTPTVLFVTPQEYIDMQEAGDLKTGYTYIQLRPEMLNYFSISAQGQSARERLDQLLYTHAFAPETISLTSIPIYYLEPNTRIYVKDENSKIEGEYIVSKITIPLAYNGTSQISATKAATRLY